MLQQATNGTYVCRCPAGFSGVRCESVQTGSLPPRGPQELTQEHKDVTVSQVLATSQPDEPTDTSSAVPHSVSSQGHTASMLSSELTWVEITLIVCLGGLLPVLLIASGATIFVVHKHRHKRNEIRANSNSIRSCPSVTPPRLALPKMNNVEENGSSRSISLDSRDLTQQRKVLNVNCSTNLWSDAATDQPEEKWTRRRLPVIRPPRPPEVKLFSPEIQGRRCSETGRKVDSVPDILGITDAMTRKPWTQEGVFIVPG